MEFFQSPEWIFLAEPWFIVFVAWSLFWKGLALWRAVKNQSKVWFVVLMIVNTMGILEILYLFVFGRKKQ